MLETNITFFTNITVLKTYITVTNIIVLKNKFVAHFLAEILPTTKFEQTQIV